MGAFGDLVSNAVDAYSGKPKGTSLDTFLDKFSNTAGKYVDELDPLGTFEVSFKFYPSLTAKELSKRGKQSAFGRVG